jgi:dipeptidyl aminopeptidase/acylaminoacyl peptidase
MHWPRAPNRPDRCIRRETTLWWKVSPQSPIPQSLVEAVGRYSDFRSALLGGWHPTLHEMLISTRLADTTQAHLLKFPGGARTQLTFYPDNVYASGFVPTHPDSMLFIKDKNGDENYQYYRYDLSTSDATLLTDGKSRNTGLVCGNDSSRMAYVSNRRDGNDMDLWVVDALEPKSDHMVAKLEGGGFSPVDWSPDDRKILLAEEISAANTNLWIVDAVTGEKNLITPRPSSVQVAYSNAKFSKDQKGIYLTTDKDSEFQRLGYLDLATRQITFLQPRLKHDVDVFDLSWDGKTIAFVANEEGLGVLHLIDTRTHKELSAPKLPPGIVGNVSWHRNNRDLAFELESNRAPWDAYSLDVKSGEVVRWTYSETGGLSTDNFSQAELIHWKSWDRLAISGFLYRPPAKFRGKRPVMVVIHGGPEAQARPAFLARNNYFLNELGVALIYPNVRGSTGYGKTFMGLDNGFLREGSYKDINSLFDWIKTQAELDSDRILVTGSSYGGFMTLAVATNYDNRICCSVDVVGPSNLLTLLEHTSGYRQDLRRVEYGDERDPKMRDFLESIAPVNKAKNITKPLFVIQGYNDPRVPHSESEQMVASVRKNGASVWYLMAKDEGHGFEKKKNQDFQFYSTILFVQQFC